LLLELRFPSIELTRLQIARLRQVATFTAAVLPAVVATPVVTDHHRLAVIIGALVWSTPYQRL
jgi:hypothetical protein